MAQGVQQATRRTALEHLEDLAAKKATDAALVRELRADVLSAYTLFHGRDSLADINCFRRTEKLPGKRSRSEVYTFAVAELEKLHELFARFVARMS